jgi:hypothetical protein
MMERDPNQPVRVPMGSRNDGKSAGSRSDNASPEAFARKGYQIVDRAERDPFGGPPSRRGIARPAYPGDTVSLDMDGDFD